MTRYRRDKTPGGTWFFTVVTHRRAPLLCQEAFRSALRRSIFRTRTLYPFKIDA
jgi:putative transposase